MPFFGVQGAGCTGSVHVGGGVVAVVVVVVEVVVVVVVVVEVEAGSVGLTESAGELAVSVGVSAGLESAAGVGSVATVTAGTAGAATAVGVTEGDAVGVEPSAGVTESARARIDNPTVEARRGLLLI